jgi:hypothetical protein
MTGLAITLMVIGLIVEYGQVIFFVNNQIKNDAKLAKKA